ncbi:MAG TPA: hypothetical protein VGA56_26370 [Opitutaceae bacterium]
MNENIRTEIEALGESANHWQCQVSFTSKDLGDSTSGTDHRHEVHLAKVLVLHSDSNGLDRVWKFDVPVACFVRLDKSYQDIKAVAPPCPRSGIHEFIDFSEDRLVIFLAPDRSYLDVH